MTCRSRRARSVSALLCNSTSYAHAAGYEALELSTNGREYTSSSSGLMMLALTLYGNNTLGRPSVRSRSRVLVTSRARVVAFLSKWPPLCLAFVREMTLPHRCQRLCSLAVTLSHRVLSTSTGGEPLAMPFCVLQMAQTSMCTASWSWERRSTSKPFTAATGGAHMAR